MENIEITSKVFESLSDGINSLNNRKQLWYDNIDFTILPKYDCYLLTDKTKNYTLHWLFFRVSNINSAEVEIITGITSARGFHIYISLFYYRFLLINILLIFLNIITYNLTTINNIFKFIN